jgi:predicted nuclease with TOPRIM domain
MRLIRQKSYLSMELRASALESENASLKERLRARTGRLRQLEQSYQELVLTVGLKGFAVEIKPEVPAKPATLVLRASRD